MHKTIELYEDSDVTGIDITARRAGVDDTHINIGCGESDFYPDDKQLRALSAFLRKILKEEVDNS